MTWEDNKYTIEFYLSDFCQDGQMIKNFPRMVNTFEKLSEVLTYAIRCMADDREGDAIVKDKPEFENRVIKELREVLSVKTEIEDVNEELDKIEERFRNIEKLIKE